MTKYNIYYRDWANPEAVIETADTLADARKFVDEYVKCRTIVDDENGCSDDVFYSSKVAQLLVYEGDAVTFDEDGNEDFKDAVIESPYFYTD